MGRTKTIAKKNVKVNSKGIAKIGTKLEGTSAISRPKILEFEYSGQIKEGSANLKSTTHTSSSLSYDTFSASVDV